jgi:hypothetical protein
MAPYTGIYVRLRTEIPRQRVHYHVIYPRRMLPRSSVLIGTAAGCMPGCGAP